MPELRKLLERVTVLVLLAPIGAVGAQVAEPAELTLDQQIEMARSMNEATRQSTVAANVQVPPDAAERFWPLYRTYRSEVNALNDELKRLVLQYAENYTTISGEDAYDLAEEAASLQIRRDELKQDYLKRFGKVVPPELAARVIQIENKLDALLQAMMAAEIPLVKAEGGP